MAYWAGGEMVRIADEPMENHPGWALRDCDCCMGIQWGGEEPRECDWCQGSGCYAVHLATGTRAMWPGGPLLGGHDEPQS